MKPQHCSTPINFIMLSAVNTPSSSAAIDTFGRDSHETHNHYYTPDGHRQARTDRGVFGRLLMGIMETLQEATSEFGSMERVPRETIKTLNELHHRKRYRVHSATFKQQLAVVKVFHGRRAKEGFKKAITLNKRLLHPSVLEMIAISSRTCDPPFIVFDSNCETGSVEVQIASALTTGLPRSVGLGFRIVGGLSAALDYFAERDIPFASLGADNFEVYITHEDQVKVGIDLNEVVRTSDHRDDADALWELLSTLCTKTFKDANRFLYEDESIGEGDLSISEVSELEENDAGTQSSVNGSSSADESQGASSTVPSVPRRELSWKRSERGSRTVASVARQYGRYLRLNAGHPYADSLRRRKPEDGTRRQLTRHRCQGYNKEEITLTSDIKDAALVLHTAPLPGEKCSICGEVVKDGEDFQCVCRSADDGVSSTIKCSQCGVWQHRQCVAARNVDFRTFVCSFCDGSFLPSGRVPAAVPVAAPAAVRAAVQRRKDPNRKGQYICERCGQDFTAAHNLRNHINSHIGFKPYQCDMCDSAFGTPYVLKRHKKAKHGVGRHISADVSVWGI
ncbi:hypothetical protein VKT23_008958 [Stygiomarasmius scandens]|uniref:C2H2-type domain-containing protein n=1 Tax=Marasmiellus scandens TaxID=2682957 RepID=A0ABR1JH53_9AGAR